MPSPEVAAPSALAELIDIMARLRDPQTGCEWDREQTFETIAPYTIEEAYEVDDAIRRGDMVALKDELGDLQLQVVYHARIAEERQAFDLGDVIATIVEGRDKLLELGRRALWEGAQEIEISEEG